MIPGKFNSREVKRMMAQMGIKSNEMTDVKKVILYGDTKNYVIENAAVTMIEAQGQKSFQIVGNIKEAPKSAGEVKQEEISPYNNEDIKLVMDQTGVGREKAIEALKGADGEPAQAILNLLSK
ncbi:nascent polypeptide-associated complex protein [Oxyplasma meridianum]|uniref:Nascent polypeptide-associated complex protein n=1 Tax=Oxyplasma meridianum TaxID=3073602 RepID=A0AAX4NJ83_9ARCH